jgi:cystathionine gamma-synthase
MRFETMTVHAGGERDPATGALAPPIHLSTTFEHGPSGERPHGYLYVREGNPTQDRLEQALAAIEGGSRAIVFASGVAAGSAYLQALPAGSHVIFPDDIYHGFRQIADEFLPRWGMAATAVDMADPAGIERVLRPNTRLIWAESPSNPLLKIVDLSAVARIARQAGARLLVDGTFATPALQRPLAEGADAVLHATTKYLGGHSDVQGGAVVLRPGEEDLAEKLVHVRKLLGSVASPFNSWLVLRGLRSLACRMERHASNAMAVASALEAHRAVGLVHYPGLRSHPGHDVARRQMKAFGGMLSFLVRGGRDDAIRVASRVKLFVNATSLGGTESLIEHRASSEGPGSPTPENLLRVSVGLEHPDDLIEDLSQALG